MPSARAALRRKGSAPIVTWMDAVEFDASILHCAQRCSCTSRTPYRRGHHEQSAMIQGAGPRIPVLALMEDVEFDPAIAERAYGRAAGRRGDCAPGWLVGSQVTVTLEVEAQEPSGVTDAVVRAQRRDTLALP